MKDNKEKRCVFCKKTLTGRKRFPICDGCQKKGRDGAGSLLTIVASYGLYSKFFKKDEE
ncbi:hypothetical protein ACQTPQ_05360 [Streptococcus hyovaginalis]|uniref:hypothetical protein n=1 Tax=Streptococcus hyovaginalis TaxID=149015 RepID=UPI003AE8265E